MILTKLSSFQISLIAVFAALQVLLTTLPLSITIGVAGSITLGAAGGPLIGILLGPAIGGLATLIGSLIGCFINPSGAIFGLLTVIPPLLGALGAGCIRIKKGYIIGIILLALLLIFYAHPFGRIAYIFPWLSIIAMIVAFSPIAIIAGSAFTSERFSKIFFGAVISSFVGVMADHMSGCAIAIWYFSPALTPEIWYLAMPIYPIERIITLIISSIIAAAIYYRLRKAGLLFIG